MLERLEDLVRSIRALYKNQILFIIIILKISDNQKDVCVLSALTSIWSKYIFLVKKKVDERLGEKNVFPY